MLQRIAETTNLFINISNNGTIYGSGTHSESLLVTPLNVAGIPQ